jgi:hypothetical protein
MAKITVKSLRQRGYNVKISHFRYLGDKFKSHDLTSYHHIRTEKWQDRINPHGGLTTVQVCDANNNPLWETEARCSKEDNFNRKVALNICMGRLEMLIPEAQPEPQLVESGHCGCSSGCCEK